MQCRMEDFKRQIPDFNARRTQEASCITRSSYVNLVKEFTKKKFDNTTTEVSPQVQVTINKRKFQLLVNTRALCNLLCRFT